MLLRFQPIISTGVGFLSTAIQCDKRITAIPKATIWSVIIRWRECGNAPLAAKSQRNNKCVDCQLVNDTQVKDTFINSSTNYLLISVSSPGFYSPRYCPTSHKVSTSLILLLMCRALERWINPARNIAKSKLVVISESTRDRHVLRV